LLSWHDLLVAREELRSTTLQAHVAVTDRDIVGPKSRVKVFQKGLIFDARHV